MFRVWQTKIDRKDRKLTSKDKVCAIHFKEEFVERTYPKLLMPDGNFFEMKRSNVILKKNAIPSIFPNYPPHKVKPIPKPRKSPKKRCADVSTS